MASERKTPYSNVNLTTPTRDQLKQLTIDLTSPVGRRLTMSEVLAALFHLGEQRRDQLIAHLKEQP